MNMLCFWNARVAKRNYELFETYRECKSRGKITAADLNVLRRIRENLIYATKNRDLISERMEHENLGCDNSVSRYC